MKKFFLIFGFSIVTAFFLKGQNTFFKKYRFSDLDDISHFIETDDGGFVICGFTNRNMPGNRWYNDMLFFKIDSVGNLVWDFVWGQGIDYAMKMTKGPVEGTILVGGQSNHSNKGLYQDFFVGVLSESGYWLDTMVFGSVPGDEIFWDMRSCADGGYILLAGGAESDTASQGGIFMLKLDKNLDSTWMKTHYTSQHVTRANSVIQTTDGGYLLGGLVSNDSMFPMMPAWAYILKTDQNGDAEWDSILSDRSPEYIGLNFIEDIALCKDGGYVFIGGRPTFKLDKNRNVVWEKEKEDKANSSVNIAENGNILRTATPNASIYDPYGNVIRRIEAEQDSVGNLLVLFTYGAPTSDGGYMIIANTIGGVLAMKYNCEGLLESSTCEPPNVPMVEVYPNPVGEQILIQIHSEDVSNDYFLEVFDVLGRMVHKQTLNAPLLNVVGAENWQGGVYLIRVRNEESVDFVKKVVKE